MATALIFTNAASASVVVGSWNLKHLGWNNGKDLVAVSTVASHFDLLALQEVMDASAVTALERTLEKQTGENWSSMTSHTVGRGTYQEAYTYIWRDSQVDYADGAVVYLDRGDRFTREPFIARFTDRDNGQQLVLASVHILYGDNRQDRTPEIQELARIWSWMGESFPGTPRIIAGDFNLKPSDAAWKPLREQGARPAITEGATTLSSINGRYANLYDNLWYDPAELEIQTSGKVAYPDELGMTHEQARSRVSDHAPVYMVTGAGASSLTTQVSHDESCIDLNTASAEDLDQLPQVGPSRASDIIKGRPWGSIQALTAIDGLGSARVSAIAASGMVCEL